MSDDKDFEEKLSENELDEIISSEDIKEIIEEDNSIYEKVMYGCIPETDSIIIPDDIEKKPESILNNDDLCEIDGGLPLYGTGGLSVPVYGTHFDPKNLKKPKQINNPVPAPAYGISPVYGIKIEFKPKDPKNNLVEKPELAKLVEDKDEK